MNPREHGQEIIEQINAGRRMATTLLQRCDVGISPLEAVRELSPTLSPMAVAAAVRLAELTAFDFASLSWMLAGLVPG